MLGGNVVGLLLLLSVTFRILPISVRDGVGGPREEVTSFSDDRGTGRPAASGSPPTIEIQVFLSLDLWPTTSKKQRNISVVFLYDQREFPVLLLRARRYHRLCSRSS